MKNTSLIRLGKILLQVFSHKMEQEDMRLYGKSLRRAVHENVNFYQKSIF